MSKKTLAYSGILLTLLVVVSMIFAGRSVLGVINNADIVLETNDGQYLLGQPIPFNARLDFALNEEATIHQARLVVNGPQPLDVALPLEDVVDLDLSNEPGVTGQLLVTATLENVTQLGGTIPLSNTLPNSTLPGSGGQFKGLDVGAKIVYDITWIPPVFLEPPPVFTLIPNTDELFAIPQLPVPTNELGTVLPDTDLKFPIPTLGAPSGTVLPDVETLFNIPQVTVSSTAPAELPDLPDTTVGFNIPQVPVPAAPTGVDRNFPDSTASFNIPTVTAGSAPAGVPNLNDTTEAFAIPDLAGLGLIPTAPAGISDFPGSSEMFNTPGGASPRGLTTDGTDFWMIIDGSPVDQIVQLDTNGAVIGGPFDGPSDGLDGITFLNNSLWVVENRFRCFDDINGDTNADENRCDRNHRIFQLNPGAMPADLNAWAALMATSINGPNSELWRDIGGITSEGTGAGGTLWLVDGSFGDSFFNIAQNGTEIDTVFVDQPVSDMEGAAFFDGSLYTSNNGTISRWNTSGVKIGDTTTNPQRDNIRGMTFMMVAGEPVLFFASAIDNKVYAGFFATSVTQNPRGLAYSDGGSVPGEAIWVLVDGDPKDKILKIDATTGNLIADFGPNTDGVADAPGRDTEGIAFLSDAIWIITNEGFVRKLFKINPTTGATMTQFDLGNTANLFDDLGGLTDDGTNLVAYSRDFNTIFTINPTTGEREGTQFPCCPPTLNGARALAYHAGRDQYYFGKSGKVGILSNQFDFLQENTLTEDAGNLTGIQGMVFNGNLLYVAISGKVTVGFLSTTVTTVPEGVTLSPTSSPAGRALWILVDGSPTDKILKVNADTGALMTAFGTGGAADAPNDRTEGITYLNGSLWIIAGSPNGGSRLFKIDPADGSVQNQFNLNDTAQIFDELGGISNDGTNITVHSKLGNVVWAIDPNNAQRVGFEQIFTCCPSFFGAKGLAHHSGRNQYFAASGGKVGIFDGSQFGLIAESTMKETGVNISGIEGLALEGNVLYIVRSGKVSKSFLATTITTEPKGIAFTPSDSLAGRALWILVNGDPSDKLMKVDPSTGSLLTTFGSDGVVDAPSNKVEGMTFFNGSLWIVANENFTRRLYEVSITDGSVLNTHDLGIINVWDDLGGITHNGTKLIVVARSFNNYWILEPDISSAEQRFPCCPPPPEGGRGLAYHSSRAQFFSARDGKMKIYNSDLNFLNDVTLKEDGININSVEGLAFNGDVLYVARNASGTGKISSGALRTSITTDPRGMAFSPDGSSFQGSPIGRALWVVVDGNPSDMLLKLDADTGALIEAFSSDGAVELPSSRVNGVTFLNNFLWVTAGDPEGQNLYQINAVSGAVLDTFNLGGGGGFGIFDPLGGLTNDGTDLLAYSGNFNDIFTILTDGTVDDQQFACCPSFNGAGALAYRSSNEQLFAADDDTIAQYVNDGFGLFSAEEFNLSIDGIEGMVFADDVLYMAHNGGGTISRAGVPSDITNKPQGLAYDANADELYILVDGKKEDHVIVVQTEPDGSGDAVVIRDFPVPSNEARSLTYMNGSLYVALRNQDPFGPPGPPRILELDPADGTELNSLDLGPITFDSIGGLSNNGQFLIATPEFGGPQAIFIDPNDGDEERRVFFFDPFGFVPDQMQGLAFRMSESEFYSVRNSKVFRFDRIGRLVEDIEITTLGVGDLRGTVFVNGTLYLAEEDGRTIQAAAIPIPPTIITTNPRGMATDGTDLYLVVDGEPKDKIMKLDTLGNLIPAFGDQGAVDSPGTETDAVGFHNGMLYVVTNDERIFDEGFGGFFIDSFARIHQLDPVTGEELDSFEILVNNPFGPPEVLFDTVSALASDGEHLYAGVRGDGGPQGVWFIIDPDNPNAPADMVGEFAGRFQFMPGFEAMEIVSDPTFGPDKELIASGSTAFPGSNANIISRFNKETGVMSSQIGLPGPVDIQGMSYIGLTLFMANDAPVGDTDVVLGTALPEKTIELTIVGNYDGRIEVDVSPNLNTTQTNQSQVIVWDIIRNPEVLFDLTTIDTLSDGPVPLEDGFILTETDTIINGRVNDPSIDEVEVGIALPFTVFVDDDVADGISQNLWDVNSAQGNGALWHVSCTGSFPSTRTSSPDCSWRYSIPFGANFSTGASTRGTMTLNEVFEVSEDATLEFFTGYITELAPDRDLKMVEVARVDSDLQGNDVVGAFEPILQIVGKGGGGAPVPPNAHPEFHFVELEPLFINPNMAKVVVDLTPFAGDRVQIRFRFNSVDAFANNGEGWYLDDIRVSGAGRKTVFVPTVFLDPPVQDGSVTYYRSFSTPFPLAEGENIVGAGAEQPYSPFLGHVAFATGFVDQTPPLLGLFGIPQATANLLQTLQGNIDDATFQSLEITQTTVNGSQVIFSLNALPNSGDFSLPVSLIEGDNTFEATAIDGGGLQSASSLSVIADITPPTASIKIVTITSDDEALIGDQFFVVVAADDTLSGVAAVEDIASGNPVPLIGDVPPILTEMHALSLVGLDPTTHVRLSSVQQGTPVGANSIAVRIVDNAGNEAIEQGELNVVSARSNRNYFLFPGENFVGLSLIPDDGDPLTIDDSSLDRLMTQDVTEGVNSALAAAMGGVVTLGDVIESTFAFNNAGNFIVHSPGAGAADTLTDLDPFQGMTMKAAETRDVGGTDFDIFKQVNVAGFSAQQAVPVKMNIEGVFFRPGELPPDKVLRVGYNLIAPHILGDTLFNIVFRGALIPNELAVSAITFERQVGADIGGNGDIVAEVFEGFVTNSLGDLLKPVLSYWTFVVSDDPVNPTTPTITP